MSVPVVDVLDRARRRAGLSQGELWLRYFELGGMSNALDVEAFVYGVLEPTPHDHDLVAHALNERFVELGGNHPVPYLEGDGTLPTGTDRRTPGRDRRASVDTSAGDGIGAGDEVSVGDEIDQ